MINQKSISLSYLNTVLKDTCKQYDKIYIGINGEYKKLSDYVDDKHLIVISEVYIAYNDKSICINASLYFSEHITEVVSTNKMMVHEFLSIMAQACDLAWSDNSPIITIKYPNGHSDTLTSTKRFSNVELPSRLVEGIDIAECDDCGGVYSAKITLTTK